MEDRGNTQLGHVRKMINRLSRAGQEFADADRCLLMDQPCAPLRGKLRNALLFEVVPMRRSLRHFRKSVFLALEHDVLNTAKAAAYSGMLMFFPAFIVLTALIAKAPEGPTVVGEIRWVSTQILPADTVRLMLSTMQARNSHPARLIASGLSLSIFAGLGLMLTLMEGFRRAYRLPRSEWRFWELTPARAIPGFHCSGTARAGYAAAGVRSRHRTLDGLEIRA